MTSKKTAPKNIHFVGIGGIGMSALARYFNALSKGQRIDGSKWAILGSDAVESSITEELRKEGITVKIGHKKDNITLGTELVIYNRAISPTNPELVAAKKMGISIAAYAEILGGVSEGYTTIAITGSHGKSTTTALAGLALIQGELDPTIFVGTKLSNLNGKNMRIGAGEYLVLEADDYGAAFLEYFPAISIVTNIDKEHLDFYKNFANVKKAFFQFLSRTMPGGVLILNRDDAPLFSLKTKIAELAKKNQLTVIWYSLSDSDAKKIAKATPLFGEHNLSNALAVARLAEVLSISQKNMLAALASYKGAWRRMEYQGKFALKGFKAPALVFDDYAHHPTEIKATLAAFKKQFPEAPLIAVFQPHQGKRLEALFGEFKTAFNSADVVIVLPIYKVRGRDEKNKYTSADLAAAMLSHSKDTLVIYLDNPNNLKAELNEIFAPFPGAARVSPIIAMMGAGDIVSYTKKLLK